jgi:hypothetical protein
MASTPTTNLRLNKPASHDPSWNVPLDENWDALDVLAPLKGMAVTLKEDPSSTRNVAVASGAYTKPDGSYGTFAGSAGYLIDASSTRNVWIDSAGALAQGAAWPSTVHVRLATVTTDASTVTSIVDARVTLRATGAVVSPATFTQTYSTADATLSAYTADVESVAYTGLADGVGGTPYASVTDLNALRAAVEVQRLFTEDIAGMLNALIDALQARGDIG